MDDSSNSAAFRKLILAKSFISLGLIVIILSKITSNINLRLNGVLKKLTLKIFSPQHAWINIDIVQVKKQNT